MAASVESEDVKIHQPSFLYKGQPLLAKEFALMSPGVAYSLLGYSILPTDEEDMQRMTENFLKNQAFHSLMKVIKVSPCSELSILSEFSIQALYFICANIVSLLNCSQPIYSSVLRTKGKINWRSLSSRPTKSLRSSKWTTCL